MPYRRFLDRRRHARRGELPRVRHAPRPALGGSEASLPRADGARGDPALRGGLGPADARRRRLRGWARLRRRQDPRPFHRGPCRGARRTRRRRHGCRLSAGSGETHRERRPRSPGRRPRSRRPPRYMDLVRLRRLPQHVRRSSAAPGTPRGRRGLAAHLRARRRPARRPRDARHPRRHQRRLLEPRRQAPRGRRRPRAVALLRRFRRLEARRRSHRRRGGEAHGARPRGSHARAGGLLRRPRLVGCAGPCGERPVRRRGSPQRHVGHQRRGHRDAHLGPQLLRPRVPAGP